MSVLRAARKVILHSTSSQCKIHGTRIMNACLAYFLSASASSTGSSAFRAYEAAVREILLSKFMTKPVLSLLQEAHTATIVHEVRARRQ